MRKTRQFYQPRLADHLLIGFGISLLLVSFATLGFDYYLHLSNLNREVQAKAVSITRSIQTVINSPVKDQTVRLEPIIQGYRELAGVIEVAVIDAEGKAVAHSDPAQIHIDYELQHPEIHSAIAEARQNGNTFVRTRQSGQPVLFYLASLKFNQVAQKYPPDLAISVLDLRTSQEAQHDFLLSALSMLGVAMVALGVMRWLLKKIMLSPLSHLTEEVANSRKSGSLVLPGNLPNNEIRWLAETFEQVFQERCQAEQALQYRAIWLQNQGRILSRIARERSISDGDVQAAATIVAEAVAETLMVERVSIWLYNDVKTHLDCIDLFEYDLLQPTLSHHKVTPPLVVEQYPAYFQAIEAAEKPIAANDAQTDPRTHEFTQTYLIPLDVQSMLDVPIRVGERTIGVLCIEQVGKLRRWTPEDENFARSVGDLLTLAVEARERRLAEELVAASENQFRTLVNNLPGAVYRGRWDRDWVIDYISDAIDDMTGYVASDFVNHSVRMASLVHPEDLETVKQLVQAAIARKVPYVLEYRVIHADGTIRWISEKGQGIFAETGELLYLDGAIFDISQRKQAEIQIIQQSHELEQALTELKRTQAQIIQNEKMSSLGQMVAGVAHEINNPVNFIYGNINHAQEDIYALLDLLKLYQQHYPNPALDIQHKMDEIDLEFIETDLPKMVSSMRVGADRIWEIVRSLRTFSRLDEAEYKTASVHDGIDSTLLILHHRLKAKPDAREIEIIKDYGEIPEIECYPGQLNQVFMNILSNAIDALDECPQFSSPISNPRSHPAQPRWIRIATRLHRDRVQIRIADNGPGISDAARAKLFDPFFTTKPVGKGTGLGLSISYQIIVDKHGGSLTCHSELNQGTAFVIELPIVGKSVPSVVSQYQLTHSAL